MSSRSNPVVDRMLEIQVTCLFTAIVLGVFGIAWTRGEHQGASLTRETLVTYGAMTRGLVTGGEYWRLLTAVFLHAGWIHLLMNTWMLYTWGGEVERTVGSVWFAFAYVTTGIGASAFSMLCHNVLSIGASGAIFGILGAVLAILYRRAGSWDRFMATPGARSLLTQMVAWLVIGFTFMGGIDNYAHLGGFLFGVPCGLLLENRRGRHRPAWIAGLAAYVLVWGALVVAACTPGLGLGNRGIGP